MTAATIGAITGAVVVLGQRSITDVTTGVLALITLFLCWKVKNIPEPLMVLGAAIIGIAVKLWLAR